MVPREHWGRARLLRDQIASAHRRWLDAAVDLSTPLSPRDNFAPQFTKQSLRLTSARWRNLPEWGRLGIAAKNGGDALQIAETRLAPFAITMADWDDPELSVAIQLCTAKMRLPRDFGTEIRTLAVVGLHGIARRYERADRSDRSVLRDLSVFARAWPDCIRRGGDFEVEALAGGKWVGKIMIVEGKPAMVVRTYVGG